MQQTVVVMETADSASATSVGHDELRSYKKFLKQMLMRIAVLMVRVLKSPTTWNCDGTLDVSEEEKVALHAKQIKTCADLLENCIVEMKVTEEGSICSTEWQSEVEERVSKFEELIDVLGVPKMKSKKRYRREHHVESHPSDAGASAD